MKKLISSLIISALISSLTAFAGAAPRSNVVITTDGPAAHDITTGSQDTELLKLHIDTNVRVRFANFPIKLRLTEQAENQSQGLLNGNASNLTDIKVINAATGEVMMGPIDANQLKSSIGGENNITDRGGDQIGYFLFTDEFIVRIVEPIDVIVTADIADNDALAGAKLTAYMQNNSQYPEIRKVSNNAWVSLNPRAAIVGAEMPIIVTAPPQEGLNHPIITLGVNTPSGAHNRSIADQILSFNITAQNEDVLLDSVTFNLLSTAGFNIAPLEPTECSLVEDGRVFSNGYVTLQTNSSAKVIFDLDQDSIPVEDNLFVGARQTKRVSLACDTQNLLTQAPVDSIVFTASLNLGTQQTPGNFNWSFWKTPATIINWVETQLPGSTLMGGNLLY